MHNSKAISACGFVKISYLSVFSYPEYLFEGHMHQKHLCQKIMSNFLEMPSNLFDLHINDLMCFMIALNLDGITHTHTHTIQFMTLVFMCFSWDRRDKYHSVRSVCMRQNKCRNSNREYKRQQSNQTKNGFIVDSFLVLRNGWFL